MRFDMNSALPPFPLPPPHTHTPQDFFSHFRNVYVCRLFKRVEDGGPWHVRATEGEWSIRQKTAGGYSNFLTYAASALARNVTLLLLLPSLLL